MSDWRREGLQECNDEASDFAQKLGCKYYSAPPCSGVQTRREGATILVTFGRPRVEVWRIVFAALPVLLVVMLLLLRKRH